MYERSPARHGWSWAPYATDREFILYWIECIKCFTSNPWFGSYEWLIVATGFYQEGKTYGFVSELPCPVHPVGAGS